MKLQAPDARKPYGSIELEAGAPVAVRTVRTWSSVAGLLGLVAVLVVTVVAVLSRESASSAVPDASGAWPGDSGAAAAGGAPAEGALADDSFVAFFAEHCASLGDAVFTPELCGPPDATGFCANLCTPGSGCADVCGDACGDADASWGAYCLLSAFADLEAVCAGTFVPEPPALPPADAVVDAPTDPEAKAVLAMDCGTHAVCAACDDLRNDDCHAVFVSAAAFAKNSALAPSIRHIVDEWEARDEANGLPRFPELRDQRLVWVALPQFLEPGQLDAACAMRGYRRAR